MPETSVCITYDFDAVSVWEWSLQMPDYYQAGVFGADVAVPRLLSIHEEYDVPATWFTPGHTIDSFPEACEEIARREDHRIQHHGWTHIGPDGFEDREAEREDMVRGVESIEALTGERPTGFRSPGGGFSPHTIDLLEELGIEWDSSGTGASDIHPYYMRRGWEFADDGFRRGEETDIVEIPKQWQRDDFYLLLPMISALGRPGATWGPMEGEETVFGRWRREFDWLYENVDGGVYVLQFHPQCIGRADLLPMIEALFEHLDRERAEFKTMSQVADEFRSAGA